MKLVNAEYNLSLELKENIVDIIVVEKPSIMSKFVYELWRQTNGEEGNFVLSKEGKTEKLQKELEMIINPFQIDFNSRKVITKLYKEMVQVGAEYYLEKEKLNMEIVQLLEKIIFQIPYDNVDYNLELDWEGIWKLYGVKIGGGKESVAQQLMEYLKVLSGLCDIHLLCLVQIKDLLEEQELEQVYQMAKYQKVHLILIEAREFEERKDENVYIIDKDQCLIIK